MKELIRQELKRLVAAYGSPGTLHSSWKAPLMGCASAADPLFGELKRTAHPGHSTPADLLEGAQSVIVYFLPFRDDIPSGNAQGASPSMTWVYAYRETNDLISFVNNGLDSFLKAWGHRTGTVAATHNFDPASLLSPWSHRHAAYIAGLGTFGLNRMLITENGCAGRLGSLVTDLELEPDTRAEEERCLYLRDGSCGACIEKCPCSSLHEHGFDRHACYARLLENERALGLAGHADVCGKCCCGLPCSLADPTA